MSVAWVDFQKAYDRVPHQWIRDMLKAVKVSRNVERTVQHAMGMRQTTFGISNGSKETFQIRLKCGVFSLLFCLAIALY